MPNPNAAFCLPAVRHHFSCLLQLLLTRRKYCKEIKNIFSIFKLRLNNNRKNPTRDIFVFEFEVRSTLCSDPHWFVPFMSRFPTLIKKFLPINALQKWKKMSVRDIKSGTVAQLYRHESNYDSYWDFRPDQTLGETFGCVPRWGFERKKKGEKVKVKVLFEKVRKWHGCVWAMSWINLWQALGIKLVRPMFYPAPDYVF